MSPTTERTGKAVLVGGLVAVAAVSFALLARDGEDPYEPDIDPSRFTTEIDNPYLPFTPGRRWVYEGETEDGVERIVVEVTSATREVMGVETVVVRDTVSVDGEVVEDTYDWYAQDDEGNVWYFGEDTHEFEDGVPVNEAGAWEAGVDGAQPGIVMQADPEVGAPYRQEFLEGEAEDMGQVIEVSTSVTTPAGRFGDVIVTKDWTPLEPEVIEHKHYARGVGLVMEEKVEGGDERIELVEASS